MPVSFTGCCIQLCASAADRLGLHTPLPDVRSDEHALKVESRRESQQGSPEPSPLRHTNGSSSTHSGKAGGGEASPSPSPASQSGRGSLRQLPVVLRVEVASKFSAQVGTQLRCSTGRLKVADAKGLFDRCYPDWFRALSELGEMYKLQCHRVLCGCGSPGAASVVTAHTPASCAHSCLSVLSY